MYLIKILFLIFLFLSNAHSNENLIIRYIDVDFLFKNSSIGKKINNNLNNEKKKIIENSKKNEEKLKKKKDDILSKKNILSQKDFQDLVIQHQKNVDAYKKEINVALNNVNKKYLDKSKDLKKKIDKILVDYASQNNISIVLSKTAIIVSNSDLDITEDILTIINKK